MKFIYNKYNINIIHNNYIFKNSDYALLPV